MANNEERASSRKRGRPKPTAYSRQVSQSLSEARNARNLSAEEVARRGGFNLVTYQGWEAPGNPTIPPSVHLTTLAEILEISIDWLLRPVRRQFEPDDRDPNGVFLIDMEVVKRQLDATSPRDPANSIQTFKRIDLSMRVVRSAEKCEAIHEPLFKKRRELRKE